MQIMAAALRQMGEQYPSELMYWLDVSDSEFAFLGEDFKSKPPMFMYAQMNRQNQPTESSKLQVAGIQIKGHLATAKLFYRSLTVFAEYHLKFVQEQETWKVVAFDFFCGT